MNVSKGGAGNWGTMPMPFRPVLRKPRERSWSNSNKPRQDVSMQLPVTQSRQGAGFLDTDCREPKGPAAPLQHIPTVHC